ncbi:MAG: pilus assembly protein PilM [Vulcanimicrobiaceae bacterium]
MRRRTYPLGIDVGSTRLRVAMAEDGMHGPRIAAVAVRDIASGSATSGTIAESAYVSALIEDAVAELGTRERRCVCAIGEPDAMLRSIKLPPMTALERDRAARFEAQRFIDFPVDEATIRLHPIEPAEHLYALGIARAATVASRVAVLKSAGLRPIGMDQDACAFGRLLEGVDAVIDVGFQRTSVHVFGKAAPLTMQLYAGGSDVTRAIERDLAIDERSAEKRKRILGTLGAGDFARTQLASDVAAMLDSATNRATIERIALVGNGARLHGLAADLEAATGAIVELSTAPALRGVYPDDVARAGAPDWSLASGLALWQRPA